MNILTISGSTRVASSNSKLLNALPKLFPKHSISRYSKLADLPIFRAELDHHPLPESVINWRQAILACDAVIISTPEYIHNLPALLKNALEWIASSGELVGKPVLAITFTPNIPRGEKAMQSLLWSLQALDARIVAQLPLFQNEMEFDENGDLVKNENLELLVEAIEILLGN